MIDMFAVAGIVSMATPAIMFIGLSPKLSRAWSWRIFVALDILNVMLSLVVLRSCDWWLTSAVWGFAVVMWSVATYYGIMGMLAE